jgi:hypothetical protein
VQNDLILKEYNDLKKSMYLLSSSIRKFKPYTVGKIYTPVELEYYDSLAFRFEKAVELFLHFFKGLEAYQSGKLSDTLRDRLLLMQKLKIIDSVDFWIEARLLRNKVAHDYLPEQLKDIYQEIFKKSKTLQKYMSNIEKSLKTMKRFPKKNH